MGNQSFVSGPFIHDVFISYTHAHQKTGGDSPLKEWSRAFAQILTDDLRTHPDLGDAVSVFFDESARPDESLARVSDFSKTLKEHAEGSAILTVLLSPHYLHPDRKWCQRERDWWSGKQIELGLPYRQHLALAHIWPADHLEWPELFKDSYGERLLSYFFFDREKAAAEDVQPFDYPSPPRKLPSEFRVALRPLLKELRLKLLALKANLNAKEKVREESAKLAEESGQLLYLHGRAEETQTWEEARDELVRCGFTVLPDEPDPIHQSPQDSIRLTYERVQTLRGCDAMLLVGSESSRAMAADLAAVGRQDRQAARALSNRRLPCAVLEYDRGTEKFDRFVKSAKTLDVHWINRSQTPWAPAVGKWLDDEAKKLREES